MTRNDQRILMDKAIKEITIPFLREQGFKGSFPHFRRTKEDRINLLTFQFSLSSSKFVVEISNCSVNGILTTWNKEIKPVKCTAHDMNHRHRMGSLINNTDYWFDFSKESIFSNIYKKRAKEIIDLWHEAEKWWLENPYEQRFAVLPQTT
ncbi:MAG: DUF4304 domain-containing protein [Mucilaginibacter sp.]|uniref:DUF4304 domain-containing protein n=1 Tax=Mucilaginibacter sp. TaxID=1882438 RepID=UPI0031A298BD